MPKGAQLTISLAMQQSMVVVVAMEGALVAVASVLFLRMFSEIFLEVAVAGEDRALTGALIFVMF